MAQVVAIVGLGFGDEGKGSTVDFLTRRHRSRLVVRYNGGAQAGHNVVTDDGRHHCFAQWGAGTLAGAKTFLSRFMMVNPSFAFAEASHLEKIGVDAPFSLLTVERDALVTTPFHVAANRCHEMARAKGKDGVHGSCGMGIGETMSDSLTDFPDVIRVRDFDDPLILRTKLESLQDRKLKEVCAADSYGLRASMNERGWLTDRNMVEPVVDDCLAFRKKVTVVDDEWLTRELAAPGHILFEGAQGVLLDQDYGFQPHTTWSDCTLGNARRLLSAAPDCVATFLGVMRAFHTRHGAGPLPTEQASFLPMVADDHNRHNDWQHGFRAGALDFCLARYAVKVVGAIDGIALTHCDKVLGRELPVCFEYEGRTRIKQEPWDWITVEHGPPIYTPMHHDTASSYAAMVADELDVPVGIISHGPLPRDRQILEPALLKEAS